MKNTRPRAAVSRSVRHGRFVRLLALCSVLIGGNSRVHALTPEWSVQTEAIATGNADPQGPGPRTADVLIALVPGVRVASVGPTLNMKLDASAAFVTSARGTISSSIQPRVDAALAAALLPRLLFVDALAAVRQVETNPFAGRVSDAASSNRRTASDFGIAPYLRWMPAPHWELLARQEESLMTNVTRATITGGESGDLRGQRSRLRVARDPLPFGLDVEGTHETSRSAGGAVEDQIAISAVRAGATYAIASADLVVGALAGHESARSNAINASERLFGITLHWQPSARTELVARAEHRFFGTGGKLDFRWRSPLSSLVLNLHREPVVASDAFGATGAAAEVTSLASSLWGSPHADDNNDTSRRSVVGPAAPLTTRQSGAIDYTAGYVQLQSGGSATWTLLGRRQFLSVQVYRQTLRQLTAGVVATLPVAVADSLQQGASLDFAHRLSPTLSADLTLTTSRIEGLGARSGEVTRQEEWRVAINEQLSPQTSATAGFRFTRLRSNALGVVSSDVPSLSVALQHRF